MNEAKRKSGIQVIKSGLDKLHNYLAPSQYVITICYGGLHEEQPNRCRTIIDELELHPATP